MGGCDGQVSFENSMSSFAKQHADVIVGDVCSAVSLNVGRFSTALNIPMLATASQSTQLSDKVNYPYLFRWCTTEVADADLHAGILKTFEIPKATVLYSDATRSA